MRVRLAALTIGACAALAGAARAEPEVLVKCDGAGAGQRFTRDGGWQPFPNPDRSILITRDKGKLSIELTGDAPISSRAVFAIPQHAIATFRVLGGNGVQNFHVVRGVYSGKPELKHTVFGARDGSGVFHMTETTLDNCSVVSPDVAVEAPAAGAPAKP
jgi:hypothetical protein